MTKTKLLVAKLKDLIILANEQLSAGHYEAGGMVIKAALDKDLTDIDASVDDDIKALDEAIKALEAEKAQAEKRLEEIKAYQEKLASAGTTA